MAVATYPSDRLEPADVANAAGELGRVKAGRIALLKAVATIKNIDGIDENTLTLHVHGSGTRLPIASLSPAILAAKLPAAEDRANVAGYLRARGLHALANALEAAPPE